MHLVPEPAPDMRHAHGFSLIEALVTCALVSILAGISAPIVAGGIKVYVINSAGQQVASIVRGARFQAVARNAQMRVRFDYPADGQYQVVLNSDGTTAAGQVNFLPSGVTFDSSTDVQIDTSGRMPAGAAESTITVTNGDADMDRTITVSTSGRVQLQ